MSNRPSRIPALARGLAAGYARILRGAAGALAFVAAILLSTAVVVVPLWLLATRLPAVFTAMAILVLGGGMAALLAAGAARQARILGGLRPWLRARVAPLLLRLAVALTFIGALYGLLLAYASGMYGLAVPLTAALVLLAGLWARRRRLPPHEEGPYPADDRGDGPPA